MANNKERRIRRKVRRSYIISTFSISLVLFLLGAVGYITASTLVAAYEHRNNISILVELSDELPAGEREELQSLLEARDEVKQMTFVGKEELFNDPEFRSRIDFPIDESIITTNPMLDCYEVDLNSDYISSEAIDAFKSEVESLPGIEHVSAPSIESIDDMQHNLNSVTLALAIFLGVLLIISILLLNNTIRLAIYSKRYLINTMKLVGATKWYIMRPFIGSALKQGISAGVVASILLLLSVYGIESIMPRSISLIGYYEVGIIVGGLVVLGVIITVVFSALSVNNFVNMKSNKIHLY